MIILISHIFLFFQFLIQITCNYFPPSNTLIISPLTQKIFTLSGPTQGTTYSIKYINPDSIVSKFEIDEQLGIIDRSLSLYNKESLISHFNKSETGVLFDLHLMTVVLASLDIFVKSNHKFDITCKPLSEIWGFNNTSKLIRPSSKLITSTLKFVGSHNLKLTKDSLLKKNKFIKIDCDGIAQGYSVDILFNFLKNKGLSNFIIEIGGEVRSSGSNYENKSWIVGLENPASLVDGNFLVNKIVHITNKAITTSGSYRKYKKIEDQYFGHIIDPIKGIPVNNGIISVTVIADDAMTADAWDNAFMVLGIKDSFELIKSMPNIGVNFIYRDKQGNISDTCNSYFRKFVE